MCLSFLASSSHFFLGYQQLVVHAVALIAYLIFPGSSAQNQIVNAALISFMF